jgi:AcrR family transcriptional regulator
MMPPPLAQRRLQHREETRRAILDAAESLLVEDGLDAFSMRKLAERCGCTAPTLYHYFRDKPGLVDALLEERLQHLVAELRRASPSQDPRERARAMCVSFARFGLRNPGHYQLLTLNRGPDAVDPPAGEEARRLIMGPLEALAQRGGIGADDFEVLRLGLWSLLHGYILLRTSRPDEPWSDAVLERSVDALLDRTFGQAGASPR